MWELCVLLEEKLRINFIMYFTCNNLRYVYEMMSDQFLSKDRLCDLCADNL